MGECDNVMTNELKPNELNGTQIVRPSMCEGNALPLRHHGFHSENALKLSDFKGYGHGYVGGSYASYWHIGADSINDYLKIYCLDH